MNKKKFLRIMGCIIAAEALIIGTLILVVQLGGTGNGQPATVRVTATQSALDVASSLSCGEFTEHGPGAGGMVLDSGTCLIGGAKYGIDTFASAEIRDAWLTAAKGFGVRPVHKADTWVFYPSTDR